MTAAPLFGASPDDWTHFDLVLGLGADLLPVVSNPSAEVSPASKLKGLGKTPSVYDRSRRVVGIAGWTAHQASDADIARWSREPDLGICLQTRTVRALDIDVADPARAAAIRDEARRIVGELPTRVRPGTGKCLLAFRLPGEIAKRKLVVEGGIVEFLANGQQFVAVGTHPSGQRYEWEGGLPVEVPELMPEEFEALWSALSERFAVEAPRAAGALTTRRRGATVAMPDPVADFLSAQGLVLGEDREGALLVACPWEHEHTTGERGDGSTVWFPAGTNGYARGHFKCLHGHCEGRSDGHFFTAIGYVEDASGDFDVIEVPSHAEPLPLPAFKRDGNGRIEATVENVARALRRPDYTGMEIRFDRFRDETMLAEARGEWRTFSDPDYVRLRIGLEQKGFKPVGRELIRDVVHLVADENPFDSAIEWLEGLRWDGAPRVELFLATYFGVEDTPYTRAVSLYLWTALAGRVMDPGCKADMVPILVGPQGAGKSTAVAAIAPATEFFTEVSFHEKEDDLARRMRGRLVAEISELRGLHTKELESIKAFITRTHESWVPKYREFAVQFPRRLVFVGTTNQVEFLGDPTGDRRSLPVNVGEVDVEAIRRDRDQLWAEAREMHALLGVAFQQAEALAGEARAEHTITDSWEGTVAAWLDEVDDFTGQAPRASGFLRAADVLKGALKFDPKAIGRRDEMRVGAILRSLGFARKKVRVDGHPLWAFVPLPIPPWRRGGNL